MTGLNDSEPIAHALQARRFAQMKRIALGLLGAAAMLYALATAMQGRHPAWSWLAAFAEAAMVGAIADWFAVEALFRHPLGLPIPHTAIIPKNKERIGANLANFICDTFLSTPQMLARLKTFDPASHFAHWLAQPAHALSLSERAVATMRYALTAFDDERARTFLGQAASAALERLDFARFSGQALDALTEDGRHQALLDDVLQQVAQWVGTEAVQEHITDAIAREVKALRYVGLDQVTARVATRKIVNAVAHTIRDVAQQPEHSLRLRFDAFMRQFIERLQNDPELRLRIERIRVDLLAHPTLSEYLHGLWDQLLGWLHDDLGHGDSDIGRRIVALTTTLGERLLADEPMRHWINEQITTGAPPAIERYREDIRRYIEERVTQWDTGEMTRELERNIGRDLQFIRVNGTLVGGLVGLGIHAVTVWIQG